MKLDQDGVEQMPRKIFSVTRENYTIYADASLMNKDIVVTLSGGNIPHLGGVVTYDYKTKKVEKIYFDSHDGRKHKDIFLAERFTEKIVSKLPGNLCVTAGVHIDGITKAQIEASFEMCDSLAAHVINWIKDQTQNVQEPKYITHLKRDQAGKLLD